jgi:ubiquinone/menaquinone biosynthesis C-methylase UbiE
MNPLSRVFDRAIDRCLEHAIVFNLNQLLLDGGKHRPIRRFLSNVPAASVIDLGCGPGNWVELSEREYLGIDTSENFIAACRDKYADDPTRQFLQANVADLQLDKSFDLALMISVLHHLSDEQTIDTLDWIASHTDHLFVLDLYPNHQNPISRWLYRMDRGSHIREPDEQRRLILQSNQFHLVKEGDFYSWNHLYHHTMFLFKSNQ